METRKVARRTSPACKLGSFASDEGAELTTKSGRRRRVASFTSSLSKRSKSPCFFMGSPFCLLAGRCSFSCSQSFDTRMVLLLVG
jgi:hypothetical protein